MSLVEGRIDICLPLQQILISSVPGCPQALGNLLHVNRLVFFLGKKNEKRYVFDQKKKILRIYRWI
ncbi:hypothetical protein L484_000955 [Morus notabilis]|uniref:Uncharacterized protein n=1 Tax=Morus notabilis TaxID=981085 RepID=W9SDP8_9ROSA|nr:hypothetical protein L484_000955 [Morus notabilis]